MCGEHCNPARHREALESLYALLQAAYIAFPDYPWGRRVDLVGGPATGGAYNVWREAKSHQLRDGTRLPMADRKTVEAVAKRSNLPVLKGGGPQWVDHSGDYQPSEAAAEDARRILAEEELSTAVGGRGYKKMETSTVPTRPPPVVDKLPAPKAAVSVADLKRKFNQNS